MVGEAIRLTGEDVDRLVDPQLLVDTLERVLAAGAIAPKRLAVEHRGSWIASMLAAGQNYFVVKVVGVYPDNPGRGLPLVRGRLLLFDATTGDLLLEAPAEQPTGWRTAAASALALKLMGYRGGGVLGVIGAGVQANYHLKLLTKLYSFDDILIHSRTRLKAERLAELYGGRVVDLDYLLSRASVVVAATTSRTPVVKGRLLRSGSYVVSIGAPRPVRELDEDVMKRARCVVVDTREGVLSESDDVPSWVRVVELAELLKGVARCDEGDIRVYKSVGTATLDLAIALHLYERAKTV
jgi:alanine dehydrogenase